MNRWAPIDIRLLQTLKPGGLHSKVDAALALSVDRMNGIERSAREYARQWAWSTDKVIRFMQDPKSYINLSRDNATTPESSTDQGLQTDTRQRRDKTLAKVSTTVVRRQFDGDETPKVCIDGGLLGVARQKDDNGTSQAEHIYVKENKTKTPIAFTSLQKPYSTFGIKRLKVPPYQQSASSTAIAKRSVPPGSKNVALTNGAPYSGVLPILRFSVGKTTVIGKPTLIGSLIMTATSPRC